MEKFILKGEYITLAQFLKEFAYISSGGEAKWYLQEAEVYVNQELENRRGKKLHVGDQIQIGEDQYEIVGAAVS